VSRTGKGGISAVFQPFSAASALADSQARTAPRAAAMAWLRTFFSVLSHLQIASQ
jgi:hypothetical protein